VTAALLRLPHLSRASSQAEPVRSTEQRSLYDAVGPGRLLELSGDRDGPVATARTSAAVGVLRDAQQAGETTAWIQPQGGTLYPPDLAACGIDLDALLVVHVPRPHAGPNTPNPDRAHPHALCKAAELLLRSGAFGLVVLDFTHGTPPSGREAWQGRLLGLARQHGSHVVLLTEKSTASDSLGTLIGARVETRRVRESSRSVRRGAGVFSLEHTLLKNKSGATMLIRQETRRGPWGMR
jgi:recombination protein RecA